MPAAPGAEAAEVHATALTQRQRIFAAFRTYTTDTVKPDGNTAGQQGLGPAGAPACLRRQACSCPSQSDVLSHAWCQACVELCLLGREGPMLG